MQNTYHRQTAKLLAMIGECMPNMTAEIMQGWIENPRALQKALRESLTPFVEKSFQVWKTLRLGTRASYGDLVPTQERLKGLRGIQQPDDIVPNGDANLMLRVTDISDHEYEVDLVVVSVGELCGNAKSSLKKIHAHARNAGLELCPAEVGPTLRLSYLDQPDGELIMVGMEPIALNSSYEIGKSYACIYGVENCQVHPWDTMTRKLIGRSWTDYPPETRFVFIRPRR